MTRTRLVFIQLLPNSVYQLAYWDALLAARQNQNDRRAGDCQTRFRTSIADPITHAAQSVRIIRHRIF
jgi:hypothetical protein